MSMTREEAIELLRDTPIDIRSTREDDIHTLYATAQMMAIDALRPVSRERVEKVWPGCDFCNTADFGEFGFEITKHYAKICCALGNWRFPEKEQFLFCPKCGKPLTADAVKMVMKRIKKMEETGNGID